MIFLKNIMHIVIKIFNSNMVNIFITVKVTSNSCNGTYMFQLRP